MNNSRRWREFNIFWNKYRWLFTQYKYPEDVVKEIDKKIEDLKINDKEKSK